MAFSIDEKTTVLEIDYCLVLYMSEYPLPTTVPIFNEQNYPTVLNHNLQSSNSIVTGNLYFNTPFVQGSNWDAVANVHTLTSANCVALKDGSIGELTIFASNNGVNIGFFKVFPRKATGVALSCPQGTQNKPTTLTTFSVTTSGNTLVVTTSPNCKICWLYIGIRS